MANSLKRLRLWTGALLLTLFAHFAWELAQARFFANLSGMPFLRHALICLRASLGDMTIAALAYGAAGLLFRRPHWSLRPSWLLPAAIWVATGLGITVLIELWATETGRWVYGPSMPVVFGIGLAPLLQWMIVPVVTLLVFRAWARAHGHVQHKAAGGF